MKVVHPDRRTGRRAHQGDPQREMAGTTQGRCAAGARVGARGLATLPVRQGGDAVAGLGRNLTAFFDGFQSSFQ